MDRKRSADESGKANNGVPSKIIKDCVGADGIDGDSIDNNTTISSKGSRISNLLLTPCKKSESPPVSPALVDKTIEYGHELLYPHLSKTPDTVERGIRAAFWKDFVRPQAPTTGQINTALTGSIKTAPTGTEGAKDEESTNNKESNENSEEN